MQQTQMSQTGQETKLRKLEERTQLHNLALTQTILVLPLPRPSNQASLSRNHLCPLRDKWAKVPTLSSWLQRNNSSLRWHTNSRRGC